MDGPIFFFLIIFFTLVPYIIFKAIKEKKAIKEEDDERIKQFYENSLKIYLDIENRIEEMENSGIIKILVEANINSISPIIVAVLLHKGEIYYAQHVNHVWGYYIRILLFPSEWEKFFAKNEILEYINDTTNSLPIPKLTNEDEFWKFYQMSPLRKVG